MVLAAVGAAIAAFLHGGGHAADRLPLTLALAEATALATLFVLQRGTEARLVHQAGHDPLTGLPNRARFLDGLGLALARTGRTGEPLAVLFLDLDRFKFVNDSLGHATGDRLLVQVAERLRGCARPGDMVARLGGDEFTILLDGLAGAAEAEAIAGCLVAVMKPPFAVGGRELGVTVSIGIAVAAPGHTDPADLLRDADVALYRAKERGKARWAVFDPAMGAALRERAELEADLGRAVARGELWLAYQPVVELATGTVVGVEALVRWQHHALGPIPPGQFIPLAEETGQVERVGRWVLAKACRQARAWQEQYADPPVVSVNLSARQFQRPDLVEVIAFMLRETGLDPALLKLEITESAVMADAETAVATLRRLKELGVGLAIDDFGTGYSSLNYLRRFPVDALKIDKAFVAGLGRDTGDEAIVEAVIGLAHTLGRQVVAEGIETAEQLGLLRAMGCEQGQGFRFGQPEPATAIEGLLENVTYAVGPRERLAG
jgi:diguanylate cyclase (GGDEF)-like protein